MKIKHNKSLHKENGVYLSTIPTFFILFQMLTTSITGNKKARFTMPDSPTEDLKILKNIIEKGKLKTVIDKTYSLNEISGAHKYAENGHSKGKIIINVVSTD